MKKSIAICCAVFMLVSLFAACAKQNDPAATTAATTTATTTTTTTTAKTTQTGTTTAATTLQAGPSATDVEKITIMSQVASASTVIDQTQWYVDWLRENLNIELEHRDYPGAEQMQMVQLMVATGDMVDVLGGFNPEIIQVLSDAKLAANLDDHKEYLPNLYGTPLFETMLQYSRDTYGLPGQLNVLFGQCGTTNVIDSAITVRWDLYEKLGRPEIATMNDLIPVLQQMIELDPVRPDGTKTTGFSSVIGVNDPAGYIRYIFGSDQMIGMLEYNVKNDKLTSMFEEGSATYRSLKWMNAMQQAGILDPELSTQTWESYMARAAVGAYMMHIWPAFGGLFKDFLDLDEPQGFAQIKVGDVCLGVNSDPVMGTLGRYFIVSAAAPDGAYRYVDHLFSYEGMDLLFNGPKGDMWDVDANGKPYITASGWSAIDGETEPKPSPIGIMNCLFIEGETLNPNTGLPMNMAYWPEYIAHVNAKNNIWKSWSIANGGVLNDYEFAVATGNYVKKPIAFGFIPPMSEDLKDLSINADLIKDAYISNAWKMINAKNQAEFDGYWADIQEKAAASGLQQCLDWAYGAWDLAKQNVAIYQ